MKYFYLALLSVLLMLCIYITLPGDNSLYREYYENLQQNSKNGFRSKEKFELQYQAQQEQKQGAGSGSSGSSGAGSNVTGTLTSTPGRMQGFYQNAAGVDVSQEEILQICSKFGDTAPYVEHFGKSPEELQNTSKFVSDPWKDKFGDQNYGVIQYLQWAPAYGGLIHKFYQRGARSTLTSSGCGSSAMSIIYSTMLHRYITPTEMCMAIASYNDRYGTNYFWHATSVDAGAMDQSSRLDVLFEDMKYNGKSLLSAEHASIDEQKWKDTMNAGGMVCWVSRNGKSYGPYWGNNGGHWVVCRTYDKEADVYYMVDSANVEGQHSLNPERTADPNTPNTFTTIRNACKSPNDVWYITPGPGYSDYLSSLSK